jgi:hypothetical protein
MISAAVQAEKHSPAGHGDAPHDQLSQAAVAETFHGDRDTMPFLIYYDAAGARKPKSDSRSGNQSIQLLNVISAMTLTIVKERWIGPGRTPAEWRREAGTRRPTQSDNSQT